MLAVATLLVPPRADVPLLPDAATAANVAGSFRLVIWPIGQAITKARPTTRLSGTVPLPSSSRWYRESAELERWSPITHSRPAGTLTVNLIWEGGLPGCRYAVSVRAMPLTVTRPWESQHFTVSPPTATTRLIRSCSFDEGSSPMKTKNSLICLITIGSLVVEVVSPSSQWPGSLKTTTSPRCGFEPNHGVSLSTRTRSPILMVCSIEPDGMTKACSRKVLSTSAISSATMMRIGTSLAALRRRFRLTLRASLRRSARPPPLRARGACGSSDSP